MLAVGDQVYEELSGGNDEVSLGGRTINARQYCSWYNFSGADQQKKVGSLSGGERNRLQLAKTLKSGGNVLMLDEPTNDLDVDTLRSLEDALSNFGGTSIIISHDRWFLDRLATHIMAYEGDSKVVWFEGSYSEYEVTLCALLSFSQTCSSCIRMSSHPAFICTSWPTRATPRWCGSKDPTQSTRYRSAPSRPSFKRVPTAPSEKREGDPNGWSTVLITALGSWGKLVPRAHSSTK
jgi:energy-coupling factor transporter ATP-binding protein EcfA2